jgi:hypothetical protein
MMDNNEALAQLAANVEAAGFATLDLNGHRLLVMTQQALKDMIQTAAKAAFEEVYEDDYDDDDLVGHRLDINLHVRAETDMPVVNVTTPPPVVNVAPAEPVRTKKIVRRDAKGRIASIEEIEPDDGPKATRKIGF